MSIHKLYLLDFHKSIWCNTRGDLETKCHQLEATQLRRRKQREEAEGKLKYTAAGGLSSDDRKSLEKQFTRIDEEFLEGDREMKSLQSDLSGAEYTVSELEQLFEQLYSNIKRKYAVVMTAGANKKQQQQQRRPSSASSVQSEGTEGKEAVSTPTEPTQGNTAAGFRDAISRIIHELTELSDLKLFVFDPLAEDIPHFTGWEQRTMTMYENAKEKILTGHKNILYALNSLAKAIPGLSEDKPLWTSFISEVDSAFAAVVQESIVRALQDLVRGLKGENVRELFGVNLKLGSNNRLAVVPIPPEVSTLVFNVANKIFSVCSDSKMNHFADVVTVSCTKNVGMSFAEVIQKDPIVQDLLKNVQTASVGYSDDIVMQVCKIEDKFQHLWLPQVTTMDLVSLRTALAMVEFQFPVKTSASNAVLINAFPLQDALISLLSTRISKLEQKEREAVLNGAEASLQDSAISGLKEKPEYKMPPHLQEQPVKLPKSQQQQQQQKQAPPTESNTETSPVTGGNDSARSAKDRKLTPRDVNNNHASSTTNTAGAALPPTSGPPRNPPQKENDTRQKAGSGSGGISQQQHAPPPPPPNIPFDSPRPNTTPVGVRGTGKSNEAGAGGSSHVPVSSLTPNKYVVQAQQGGPSGGGGAAGSFSSTTEVSKHNQRQMRYGAPGHHHGAAEPQHHGPLPLEARRNVWESPKKDTSGTNNTGEGEGSEAFPSVYASRNSEQQQHQRTTTAPADTKHSHPPTRPRDAEIDSDEIQWLLMKERESMERIRKLREQEEERRLKAAHQAREDRREDLHIQQQQAAAQSRNTTTEERTPPRQPYSLPAARGASGRPIDLSSPSSNSPPLSSGSPPASDPIESARRARQERLLQQERDEQDRKRREAEQKVADAEREKRRQEERRRAMENELERRLEEEMQRRAQQQQREKEARDRARREREEEARKRRESEKEAEIAAQREEQRRAREESERLQQQQRERELQKEKQRQQQEREEEEMRTAAALSARRRSNEESALRKKLALPPVQQQQQQQQSSARTAQQPSHPSPTTASEVPHRLTPVEHSSRLPPPAPSSGRGGNPSRDAQTFSSNNNNNSNVALSAATTSQPQPQSSSARLVVEPSPPSPLTAPPSSISLLDEYRSFCSQYTIKPNSGLLKILPKEPGKNVAEINLDLNYIGVKGVQPLLQILKINRGLRLLNLKDNNLENNEVRLLVNVLLTESGDTLESLDLSNNPISLAGGSALMELVTKQKSLKRIVLKGTLIQPKVVEKIVEAARNNGSGY